MAISKYTLYRYVKVDGTWRYCKAAYHDNGKIKRDIVFVNVRQALLNSTHASLSKNANKRQLHNETRPATVRVLFRRRSTSPPSWCCVHGLARRGFVSAGVKIPKVPFENSPSLAW